MHLVRELHSCVHGEVFVVDNDFLIEVVELALLHLSHLLDHIVTRNKNCFEVISIRECLLFALNFTVEVVFALGLRIVLKAFQSGFLVSLLLNEGNFEVVDH